jgi:hypothetical protein
MLVSAYISLCEIEMRSVIVESILLPGMLLAQVAESLFEDVGYAGATPP